MSLGFTLLKPVHTAYLVNGNGLAIGVFDRGGDAWAIGHTMEGLPAGPSIPGVNVFVHSVRNLRGHPSRVTHPRAFVIGQPIAHSRSPLLHGHWLRTLDLAGTYERVEVAPENLARFIAGLRTAGYVGGNVTVPHKTAVVPLVDDLDEAARVIGAVNTLWFEGDRLWGGNTDAAGFLAALDQEAPEWDSDARTATVIGAGGAARAIVHGLLQRGLDVRLANRSRGTADALSHSFARLPAVHALDAMPELLTDTDLLVNTTALGMAGKPPLDLDLAGLKRGATVCDIVYVPLETSLLRQARARGHRAVGGLGMLMHQAVPGFARWFGQTPEVTPGLRAALEADVR